VYQTTTSQSWTWRTANCQWHKPQVQAAGTSHDLLESGYFGTGAYGVEAAARKYFAKSASSLTLEEAALLVGLIKSPNYYSPQAHRERALERRNVVLDEMVAQGSVSRIDAALAKAKPVQVLE
jgi:membrane peptidoglycan carboxypeptidase